LLILALFLLFSSGSAHAESTPSLHAPVLNNKYSGGFPDDFLQELTRVQTFLAIAQQTIATQLGLTQAGNGFAHPVQIRFDDGAPSLSENPYFYVVTKGTGQNFSQELIANVETFARKRKEGNWKEPDLRDGFYYTMTKLILNDVTNGQGFPLWIQEGLAVYVSGSGESFVQDVAQHVARSKASRLVEDLNTQPEHITKVHYARYYLAIKYIQQTGGINAFQNLIREIVQGNSPADSVQHTLGTLWPEFQQNVKAYSLQQFQQFTPDDKDLRLTGTAQDTDSTK
jgi:hypothetical protein